MPGDRAGGMGRRIGTCGNLTVRTRSDGGQEDQ